MHGIVIFLKGTNTYFLFIPNDLWRGVEISESDVQKYSDILCQDEDMLPKMIAESKDGDLETIAPRLYQAYYVMRVSTIWNSGLMRDENFRNRCAEVARAELQLLGFKMLTVLPMERKKIFLDQVSSSISPPYALRLWADYVCAPIANNEFFDENEIKDFPRTHLSDVIKKIGFVSTIAWLRRVPNYRNFEDFVNTLSEFLLDSEKLKSYAMFDSAFFPYNNKE